MKPPRAITWPYIRRRFVDYCERCSLDKLEGVIEMLTAMYDRRKHAGDARPDQPEQLPIDSATSDEA